MVILIICVTVKNMVMQAGERVSAQGMQAISEQ